MLRFCIPLLLQLYNQEVSSKPGMRFNPYPKNPNLRFSWDMQTLVMSHSKASEMCRKENAFLAILNTPELWNWIYEEIEQHSVTSKGEK